MEQQNQQQMQRQIAYKVPINALLENQYVEQQGWNPNYIQINGKQVSRINLIATVIDKQLSSTLATLILDDSTGIIQAKYFNEDVKKAADISIGDTILVIGKPRKFNDQMFLTLEISRKINPLWVKIRKDELQKEFNVFSSTSDQNKKVEDAKQQQHLNRYNEKILELIRENDGGSGADMDQVISSSGLKESEAFEIIGELIKLGEIYEPKPNRIKILG